MTRSEGEEVKRNARRKRIPVSISTIGYCTEIAERHCLHLPERRKKLARGMRSCEGITFPQAKHFERPLRVMPVCKRRARTLRKLPTMAPKTKMKSERSILPIQ